MLIVMLCRLELVTLVAALVRGIGGWLPPLSTTHRPLRSAQDRRQVTGVSVRHAWR